MDSQMPNDDRKDGDELVFQDLLPEQPANALQKRIISMQQNWPPRWRKRHTVILSTVLSILLITFLAFESRNAVTQQNSSPANGTTSGSALVTTSVAQVLSYQDVLYVIATQLSSNTGTLEALNIHTGTLMWSYQHHNAQALILAGNMLYVQTDKSIVALNASSRTQVWETQASNGNYKWQINQGILFMTSNKGALEALDAQTGKQLWQTNQTTSQWQVDSGIFYITPTSGFGLTTFNASTGKMLWHNAHIYQDLTVDSGNFYLQNDKTQSIEAYNGSTGHLRWQIKTHGQKLALSAHSGLLILSDIENTQVEVLNGQTGKLLWQSQGSIYFPIDNPDQAILSSRQKNETDIIRITDGTILHRFSRADALISLEDGVAFFLYYPQSDSTQSGGNKFFVINIEAVRISDGNTIWIHQTREEFPLTQANTIGIVPINDNTLILLSATTGQTLWQHTFDTNRS